MLKDSVPATAEPITSAIKTPDGAKSADEPLTRPLANRPAPSALSAGFCCSLLPILYYLLPSPPRHHNCITISLTACIAVASISFRR